MCVRISRPFGIVIPGDRLSLSRSWRSCRATKTWSNWTAPFLCTRRQVPVYKASVDDRFVLLKYESGVIAKCQYGNQMFSVHTWRGLVYGATVCQISEGFLVWAVKTLVPDRTARAHYQDCPAGLGSPKQTFRRFADDSSSGSRPLPSGGS